MAVKIMLHQVRTSDPEGYKIENEILDGIGQTEDIDPNLFVFRYVDGSNDSYQHVVTKDDLDNYPARGETGWNTFGALYRYKIANLIYSDLTGANEQATIMQDRLQELVTEYEAEVLAWDGTDVYDYQSDDSDVQVQLTQVKSQEDGDIYRLNSSITAVTGITDHLYLFSPDGGASPDPATDTYVRVATVYDIKTYPEDGDWTSEAYYRAEALIRDFNTLAEAETRDSAMQTDLDALAQSYDTFIDDFEGDDTITYNP